MVEIKRAMRKVKSLIESTEFVNAHKRSAVDFSRKSKLDFSDVVTFVLSKTGNTFDLERYSFCMKTGKDVTSSAICQAREKVRYTAFEAILKETSKAIIPQNLYKGYRIISYDGMQGELPRTPELMENYRPSESSQYPMFHALAELDVLNCCYTNAIFAPAPADERDLAYKLLETHDYVADEILLYDRGFPSVKLIQKLDNAGKKYIMRVSSSFLREVNEFTKSKAVDKHLHVVYDKRRKATSRISFDGPDYAFDMRCVKISLPGNKTEVLITNLSKAEMSKSEIGDLYNLRWRIETAFLDLKYAVHIEDFLGKKEEFIKQEFFTSLIQANLSMMFMEIANAVILRLKKTRNLTTKQTNAS